MESAIGAASAPAPSRMRRLVQRPLVRIGLALLATTVPSFLAITAAKHLAQEHPPRILPGVAGALTAWLAYCVYVRLVEQRRVAELSASRALPEAAAGLVLGAAMVAVVVGVLALFGAYEFTGANRFESRFAVAFVQMVFVGVFEEILFRGIVFRITQDWLGSWAALAVSALVFGLAHIPGGAGLQATVITVVAGAFFAAAYVLTRRLWLCIGIHIGWNYTLGFVFSIAVSGHPSQGLLDGRLVGPEWLTGGNYGLEASWITLALLLGLALAFARQAAARGHVVPWRGRGAN